HHDSTSHARTINGEAGGIRTRILTPLAITLIERTVAGQGVKRVFYDVLLLDDGFHISFTDYLIILSAPDPRFGSRRPRGGSNSPHLIDNQAASPDAYEGKSNARPAGLEPAPSRSGRDNRPLSARRAD